MDYKFTNNTFDIDTQILPQSNKINSYLLKNSSDEVYKALDFINSSDKFLYIHGFIGAGKRQFIDYICEFIDNDVLKLEYNCGKATVCDDILLAFNEIIEKASGSKGINLNAKITTLNIKFQKLISSIKKPILIIIHSYDEIQDENIKYIKELLTNPINANIDDYLQNNGLDRKTLLDALMARNIVEKETKIEEKNGSDAFSISYKIPKRNFERKMRRLYSSLFEKNEISESTTIIETDCGGAMQGGGENPSAGQYEAPLKNKNGKFPIQRRQIKTVYVTNEQCQMLKEMGTSDAGNYQYDVPLNFNGGNDPTYNHKNIIANGIPGKKIGVRKKTK